MDTQYYLILTDTASFIGTKAIFKFLGVNKVVSRVSDTAGDAIGVDLPPTPRPPSLMKAAIAFAISDLVYEMYVKDTFYQTVTDNYPAMATELYWKIGKSICISILSEIYFQMMGSKFSSKRLVENSVATLGSGFLMSYISNGYQM